MKFITNQFQFFNDEKIGINEQIWSFTKNTIQTPIGYLPIDNIVYRPMGDFSRKEFYGLQLSVHGELNVPNQGGGTEKIQVSTILILNTPGNYWLHVFIVKEGQTSSCCCFIGYDPGDRFDEDDTDSWRYYLKIMIKKGSQNGDPASQVQYSFQLEKEGKDIDAFKLIEIASAHGYVPAQFEMAHSYAKGIGIPKNIEKALYWYTKASEQGYGNASANIGVMYYNGDDVEKNVNKSLYWLELAVKQGFYKAYYNIGYIYNKDLNNPEKAFENYVKGADLGDETSLHMLGRCHEKGIGTEENLPKAIECYKKAYLKGSKLSAKALRRLNLL